MHNVVIGKRIPIGAAINGLVLFGAELWNVTHPESTIGLSVAGSLAISLTAIAQIIVVNYFGVTVNPEK